MQSIHKKTIETIINSGNHYLAAVKGNQPKLDQAVKTKFVEHDSFYNIFKGHGRIEKRRVSTAYLDLKLPKWSSIKTLIKVESERQLKYKTEFSTRYYISDLTESAFEFYQRIRGYWGVENKVHYVRDVTQGEDKSRIRTLPLPQILAIARNLALNLYRDSGFDNMAQAQRKCQFSLKQIASLFRMK
nr:ISAs1 family transposase [Pleurocapsa sp. PCC 7319]